GRAGISMRRSRASRPRAADEARPAARGSGSPLGLRSLAEANDVSDVPELSPEPIDDVIDRQDADELARGADDRHAPYADPAHLSQRELDAVVLADGQQVLAHDVGGRERRRVHLLRDDRDDDIAVRDDPDWNETGILELRDDQIADVLFAHALRDFRDVRVGVDRRDVVIADRAYCHHTTPDLER